MTSNVTYLGELRTNAVHLASENSFITDAPLDNQGKGEAFSPTDIVSTALASCLLTIMGIKARDLGIDIAGTTAKVSKIMTSNPRRINEIKIAISISKSFDTKTQSLLERAALKCPVANSLHPDLNQNISFNWPL
ncbi:MAG: osmotically inducible protein OsmC [Flavobacteriaceae bacterium]|nr:osmotically inducible protein OsmC [Flavobacteriaceae bacterium]